MPDIAFALNYTNLYMIDITPDAAEKTWARIGAGISDASFDGSEEVSDDPYYDGDGMANSEVTGGQLVITFTGNRKYGDPAQDFVAGLQVKYGQSRHTTLRRIAPDGEVIEGDVTIANIRVGGGGPNKKGDFGFEARFNGLPGITAGTATEFPSDITASKVTVKVGETAEVGATATPATSSSAFVYAVEDDSIATVDASGTVTGVAVGETKVSVKSAVLLSVRAEVDVKVNAATGA